MLVALCFFAAACGGGAGDEPSAADGSDPLVSEQTLDSGDALPVTDGEWEQWLELTLQCPWLEDAVSDIDAEFETPDITDLRVYERHFEAQICLVGNIGASGEPGPFSVELVSTGTVYDDEPPHPGATLLSEDAVSEGEWTVLTSDVVPDAYHRFDVVVSAEPGAFWRVSFFEIDEPRSEWHTDRYMRAASRMSREDLAAAIAEEFDRDFGDGVDLTCVAEAMVSSVDDSRLREVALAFDESGFRQHWAGEALTPMEQQTAIDASVDCLDGSFDAVSEELLDDTLSDIGFELSADCVAALAGDRGFGQAAVRTAFFEELSEISAAKIVMSIECISEAFQAMLSTQLTNVGLAAESADCVADEMVKGLLGVPDDADDDSIDALLSSVLSTAAERCLTEDERRALGV